MSSYMRRAVIKNAAKIGFLPVESPLRLQKPVVIALNTLIVVTTAKGSSEIQLLPDSSTTYKPGS